MISTVRPALIAVAAVIGPMHAIFVCSNSESASSPNKSNVLITPYLQLLHAVSMHPQQIQPYNLQG